MKEISFRSLTWCPADFVSTNVQALWEYGVEDMLRQSKVVSLRRIENGTYKLSGDVDPTVRLKAKPG